MDLKDALAKIKTDPALIKKFEADPKAVLGDMGVDTKGLMIGKAESTMEPRASICASIGCVRCASVGT